MRGYLACLLIFVLIIAGQGYLMAVEPLPGSTAEGIPVQIAFVDTLNTYSFPLEQWGLRLSFDWANDVFNGYRLICTDEEKLQRELKRLAESLEAKPADATIQVKEEGDLVIIPSLAGRRLELTELSAMLLGGNCYQEYYPLSFKTIRPTVSTEDLARIKPDTLWGSYETILADIPDRTENVRLASSFINGLILGPGEEFSFNERVGPRIKERGFRVAQIIAGGGFRPGVGGGVCQVSSTLYNAVRLAGLKITERHPHSLKVAYVPDGDDATVYYGSKDFRFANNSSSIILLRAKVVDLKLQILVYGHGPKPTSYE